MSSNNNGLDTLSLPERRLMRPLVVLLCIQR